MSGLPRRIIKVQTTQQNAYVQRRNGDLGFVLRVCVNKLTYKYGLTLALLVELALIWLVIELTRRYLSECFVCHFRLPPS